MVLDHRPRAMDGRDTLSWNAVKNQCLMSEKIDDKIYSLKEAIAEFKVTGVRRMIRRNVNNYPYITFERVNEKGEKESENIYLAKSLESTWETGHVLTDDELKDLGIRRTTNKDGEMRLKLCMNVPFESLEDIFADIV